MSPGPQPSPRSGSLPSHPAIIIRDTDSVDLGEEGVSDLFILQ